MLLLKISKFLKISDLGFHLLFSVHSFNKFFCLLFVKYGSLFLSNFLLYINSVVLYVYSCPLSLFLSVCLSVPFVYIRIQDPKNVHMDPDPDPRGVKIK